MTAKQYYKEAYRYERIRQMNTEYSAGAAYGRLIETVPQLPYWILVNAKTSYFLGKYR